MFIRIVPKWSKDAKEFSVSVHYDDEKGSQVRIPKPLLERMGNPDKVIFVIDGKDVKITPQGKAIPKKSISWKRKKELT